MTRILDVVDVVVTFVMLFCVLTGEVLVIVWLLVLWNVASLLMRQLMLLMTWYLGENSLVFDCRKVRPCGLRVSTVVGGAGWLVLRVLVSTARLNSARLRTAAMLRLVGVMLL